LEVTGTSSVSDLRSRSPEELKQFAERIVLEFASTAALEGLSRQPPSKRDELQEQVIQFNRDLLEYLELDDAIKQVLSEHSISDTKASVYTYLC